jgi:hypothetical protein
VRSETAMPSIFSSPWIRRARQKGWAPTILSINRRIQMPWPGDLDVGHAAGTVAPRIYEIASGIGLE